MNLYYKIRKILRQRGLVLETAILYFRISDNIITKWDVNFLGPRPTLVQLADIDATDVVQEDDLNNKLPSPKAYMVALYLSSTGDDTLLNTLNARIAAAIADNPLADIKRDL